MFQFRYGFEAITRNLTASYAFSTFLIVMAFGKVYSYGFYPFMWLWFLSIYVVMGYIHLCSSGFYPFMWLWILANI